MDLLDSLTSVTDLSSSSRAFVITVMVTALAITYSDRSLRSHW